ncbi:Ubiquitin carboxyl-terminal hydrolase 35 [Mortierella polycephala]|uniref:Ubiquitin carboxyl-terminal hydrolase 35 n=1 Tax=Mortierella polycephala TaxID=41804 RepID=A0A9P6TXL5_9FUNG|nr:Ubiquitin carboxyl-terminal hydrolase 35 [Mortierella polycephala]
METIIKRVLAQPTLQDNVKSTAITKLLAGTAALSIPDASVLLDLGLDLKTTSRNELENQTAHRILLAVSIAHRDLYFARLHSDWIEGVISEIATNQDYVRKIPLLIAVVKRKDETALTEAEKQEVEKDMVTLQRFAEKSCIAAQPPLPYPIQCLFIAMYLNLVATRPLATASYIAFLVDHLAIMPIPSQPQFKQTDLWLSKNAIDLLKQCWENGPDNVFMTLPQLFLNLSDDQQECSLAIGRLLQAVPEKYTSVIDPFIQNLDSGVLWRLKFTVQRLIDWLVTTDMTGIGIWIVAIMESLASRGEFMLLRELADKNIYKIARQLAFKARRDDALLVLRLILFGYHHSPVLFHNVAQGLIPLLVSCRKSHEDIAFATEVCNLAQTLVIHFGDADSVGTKVQKARTFLDLPIVPRADALRTMQEYSWKKSLNLQYTSAGSRRRTAFVQPLGKVGLVNLGNSCFMNSAIRALVDPSKVMTTRLRETFTGLSTSRLSFFTPAPLYKALPDWLNDGHQQDAAEFTKILFSRLEDEGPVSKRTLSSFHGTVINQIKCSACGTVSSTKEEFYDLAIPLPRLDSAGLEAIVDIFPLTEELNDENNNKYFCDHCQSLQNAMRYTMLSSLPMNLIITLNRFEFDKQRSRRIKIDTPILLSESIQIKIQDGHETQKYELYAVVIHTGESANHGHYYTYAKELDSHQDAKTSNQEQATATVVGTHQKAQNPTQSTWLLYNDTNVAISSFEAMQQALASSRKDTPYILFFQKADKITGADISPPSRMTVANL